MLRELLTRAGETDLSSNAMADLAGEIANTMAGNARSDFGRDFMISVPVVIRGTAEAIQVPKETLAYVIPIKWAAHEGALVVSVT